MEAKWNADCIAMMHNVKKTNEFIDRDVPKQYREGVRETLRIMWKKQQRAK